MSEDQDKSVELTPYQKDIKFLSDAIVRAQSPIRILDAVKWGPEVKEAFFADGFKEQPRVTRELYLNNLTMDWEAQREKFHMIERETTKKLGQFNVVGQILRRICNEYLRVLQMLESRGTHEFYWHSQALYGSLKMSFMPVIPRSLISAS